MPQMLRRQNLAGVGIMNRYALFSFPHFLRNNNQTEDYRCERAIPLSIST